MAAHMSNAQRRADALITPGVRTQRHERRIRVGSHHGLAMQADADGGTDGEGNHAAPNRRAITAWDGGHREVVATSAEGIATGNPEFAPTFRYGPSYYCRSAWGP